MTALSDVPRQCVVLLRDGRVYLGRGWTEDRWLHFSGQRKLESINRPYCDKGAKTWPQALVAEIRWAAQEVGPDR